jgi:phospholipase/carboxylesterase
MTRRLLIVLHGVGARGSSVAWMADHLGLPAGVAVEAPDAPFPFDAAPQGPARQWFSVAGVTAANRPARVQAARAAFDAVIAPLVARHGLTGQNDRVALAGFSQGAIMGLDAVVSGRWPVGLLLAFSGRLATPAPALPLETPVLIAHGSADPVIPVSEAGAAHAALAGSELVVEQGLGHAPGPLGMARARAMVARWAQAEATA